MSKKPIVHYQPSNDDHIKLNESALVYPTDHWSYLVSNKRIVHTSMVVYYDRATGVFETMNTIYKPVIKGSNLLRVH
jgi:hypothetical protein